MSYILTGISANDPHDKWRRQVTLKGWLGT